MEHPDIEEFLGQEVLVTFRHYNKEPLTARGTLCRDINGCFVLNDPPFPRHLFSRKAVIKIALASDGPNRGRREDGAHPLGRLKTKKVRAELNGLNTLVADALQLLEEERVDQLALKVREIKGAALRFGRDLRGVKE